MERNINHTIMKTCHMLMTALLLLVCTRGFSQEQTESTQSFNLKYKFAKGDKFQIKKHSQQDSYLNVNGEEERTTNVQDGTLLMTVTSVSGVQATVSASFQQINLQSSTSDQHISVNTSSDDNGLYNRLFKAMTNKNFTMVIQQDGVIKNISGLDAIFDQMIAALPGVKPAERPTLKRFLQSQYGPEALKSSMAFILPHYPARTVQVNGSWMNQLYTAGFYTGRLTTYWKLEYGDKYTIKLSNTGKFSTDSAQKVDLGGGQMGFVDLKGNTEGNFVIDPETDWPSLCVSHVELNGNYIYISPKNKKKKLLVPVRVVRDASFQFKHL